MSKLGCLVWRWLFQSGDKKRLAKQVQDLSDLQITRDLAYADDGDRVISLTSTSCLVCPTTRR
jgi:hypothetical protein